MSRWSKIKEMVSVLVSSMKGGLQTVDKNEDGDGNSFSNKFYRS